jgi:hypothetical protein
MTTFWTCASIVPHAEAAFGNRAKFAYHKAKTALVAKSILARRSAHCYARGMNYFRVLGVLLLAGCAAEPARVAATPASEPVTVPSAVVSSNPASSASAPSTPVPDLSTADKARSTLYALSKSGDKEGFRRCVSKGILARFATPEKFDAWFKIWQDASARHPEGFPKVEVIEEDGSFKLNEI